MTSPDPPALRKRRQRAHKRGDHSLCKPGRCPEVVSRGPIEASLARHLEGIDTSDGDLSEVMATLARRLAAQLDTHMSAAGARELRATLELLRELQGEAGDARSRDAAERMLHGLRELVR